MTMGGAGTREWRGQAVVSSNFFSPFSYSYPLLTPTILFLSSYPLLSPLSSCLNVFLRLWGLPRECLGTTSVFLKYTEKMINSLVASYVFFTLV